MDMVATDRLMIAGMHIGFPGVGHVVRIGLRIPSGVVERQPLSQSLPERGCAGAVFASAPSDYRRG
jgi:hypothetical protein